MTRIDLPVTRSHQGGTYQCESKLLPWLAEAVRIVAFGHLSVVVTVVAADFVDD
jgi:P2-related tail formation protein